MEYEFHWTLNILHSNETLQWSVIDYSNDGREQTAGHHSITGIYEQRFQCRMLGLLAPVAHSSQSCNEYHERMMNPKQTGEGSGGAWTVLYASKYTIVSENIMN